MAAKRFLDKSDEHNEKRRRTRPSLASVISEVVTVNFLHNFWSALEPMLRRVVKEEVDNGLRRGTRSITRSPSLRIQALEPSTLKLIFSERLSLPIFTGSKILDPKNNPLQILLVDTRLGDQLVPAALSFPIKVEIVALDGDFPPGDRETWNSEEFDKNIVRQRAGKRPLLTGDLLVTMRDVFAPIGEIEFTDNSSWIRSRKFRLGARVIQGTSQSVKIQAAVTEDFVVKDHRGELYKKHHPPMLNDEVWRLKKIGKDGAFHRKLASEGIHTVQDFLKLSIVDSCKLRRILGLGMSEKLWEITLKHARTCDLGSKLYVLHGTNHNIFFNPICQVVKAMINGQLFSHRDLTNLNRSCNENLIREAYANWSSLEEVDELLKETALLTEGDLVDQYPIHRQNMGRPYQQHAFLTDESTEVASIPSNIGQAECNDWVVSSAYLCTPFAGGGSGGGDVCYTFSDSSSDGDLTPARSIIHRS